MPIDTFDNAIAPLKSIGGQRVWSLMISLFGDLARGEGNVVDGPVLSAIMAAMDVRPEAARVALHRLRKDNWIQSVKHGRISQHSLTPQGRAQSQTASVRIYTTPSELAPDWQLVVTKDSSVDLEKAGFTPLTARCYVGDARLSVPGQAVSTPGQSAPDWMKRQLEPAALADGYQQLAAALAHASQCLSDAHQLSPLQTASLRCLIVHNWRRLALKHTALPRPLMRNDWPGLLSLELVADMLGRYPRPELSSIL